MTSRELLKHLVQSEALTEGECPGVYERGQKWFYLDGNRFELGFVGGKPWDVFSFYAANDEERIFYIKNAFAGDVYYHNLINQYEKQQH